MLLDRDSQTIVAQCTPKGTGALALIRISGKDAVEITTAFSHLPTGKQLSQLPTHTIHYGKIVDQLGTLIDHVMFLLMRSPRTFTGQNTVEITCHNNPFVIENILQLAIANGARHAQRGEFAKRSFLHGKIDLVQAEAINELIHASNQLTLRRSLEQLDGSLSYWLAGIEKSLLSCLALCQASFEFIDEENMEFGPQIKQEIEHILQTIGSLKKTFDQQRHIRQGVRIAFLGSVNAGKSSLFNALLKQKRAIVNERAGTTRDVIEAGVYIDQTYWTLVDTAGLRKTKDSIEQEGIRRSMEEAEKADVIVLVYDCSHKLTDKEQAVYDDIRIRFLKKIILVANKADLQRKTHFGTDEEIATSGQTGTNVKLLQAKIAAKIAELFESIESPFLLNQRHMHLLLNLEQNLQGIMSMLHKPIAYELLSCHIQDTLESLTEMTGKTISEKGMDAVFKEFCIGK